MDGPVIAYLNVAILVLATALTLVFYLMSVRPAAMALEIGPRAYQLCTRYRVVASVFITIAAIDYFIYFFYPLPIPLPQTFPWPWWVSVLLAILIAIPSSYILYRGVRDAGEETLFTKQEHTMYGGIYEKIRHPQAAGELPLWWSFSFILNSPFLALYSIVWIPVFIIMSKAEERDLLIRYGDAYAEYQERTGFYLPKLRSG